MTKLTATQQELVKKVTAADLNRREVKRYAEAEAKRQAEAKIADAAWAVDLAVRAAVQAGVPLAEFRKADQGLHTKNQDAVKQSLARTEGLATIEQELAELVSESSLYSFREGKPIVTPPADELLPLAREWKLLEWETELILRMNEYDLLIPENEYTITDGSLVENGTGIAKKLNPVCTWWEQGTHKADAREWFAAHTPAE